MPDAQATCERCGVSQSVLDEDDLCLCGCDE